MNKQKVRRYVLVMISGVVLNLGLYAVAHFLHLPVWMDSIGTAYTAMLLEPAAGLIVAFATNFYQATVFYGLDSLFYYFSGAVAALCFGCLTRKEGKLCWKRLPVAAVVYILVGTLLSAGLSLWRAHGSLDSGWEAYFMQWAINSGASHAVGVLFGTFVLKVFDSVLLVILLPLLYKMTPGRKEIAGDF